jgi:hypothetical protein
MMVSYPQVRDEEDTLRTVLSGRSIARFGDGEFKIAAGSGCVSQVPDKNLRDELRKILYDLSDDCIVGIPRLDPRSPKYENWKKYEPKYPRFLNEKKRYYSSLITRPDSAPWIYNRDFFWRIESLWRGEEVVLVHGSDRSLTADFPAMKSAGKIHSVTCARRDAYQEIDAIEMAVADSRCLRALLCCGPTATCLAWRLAARGIHAIDLGHIGMFWFNEAERPKWMRSRSEKSLDSGGRP